MQEDRLMTNTTKTQFFYLIHAGVLTEDVDAEEVDAVERISKTQDMKPVSKVFCHNMKMKFLPVITKYCPKSIKM